MLRRESSLKTPKRFLEHLNNPERSWEFSAKNIKERGFWDDDMRAYEDMIHNMTSQCPPWYAVPTDNKWFTRIVVALAIVETLDQLNLSCLEISAEARGLCYWGLRSLQALALHATTGQTPQGEAAVLTAWGGSSR